MREQKLDELDAHVTRDEVRQVVLIQLAGPPTREITLTADMAADLCDAIRSQLLALTMAVTTHRHPTRVYADRKLRHVVVQAGSVGIGIRAENVATVVRAMTAAAESLGA